MDKLIGDAARCTADCLRTPMTRAVVSCDDGDPCTDDMQVPSSTACTNECRHGAPKQRPNVSCDDGNPCTDDMQVPSSTACTNECRHGAPRQRTPAKCDDTDPCMEYSQSESNTACTYTCVPRTRSREPITCDDANPCTTDAPVPKKGSCAYECQFTPHPGMSCSGAFSGMKCNAQGQCELPALGLCGNGFIDEGESCDNTSMQDCPSCNDTNPCTTDGFTGSPETCNIVCQHKPIPGC